LIALIRDTQPTLASMLASLEPDEWEITSFNSKIRIACARLINPNGIDAIYSINIPPLTGDIRF